ncbi:uncharacterized protein EAF02_000874 [Botrytis sinoallii]|uniref:uncharacterized protein n=1 Tax=Botrytis sinoallii TaxID=1463999 RepID=UPI0019011EEA|nr:uncharacterized protein EAF02_000874 [Botrytis sinoallii]KAF7893336.1 hypothetical protein EAF02_000874 [Botrytis sinoallii]
MYENGLHRTADVKSKSLAFSSNRAVDESFTKSRIDGTGGQSGIQCITLNLQHIARRSISSLRSSGNHGGHDEPQNYSQTASEFLINDGGRERQRKCQEPLLERR